MESYLPSLGQEIFAGAQMVTNANASGVVILASVSAPHKMMTTGGTKRNAIMFPAFQKKIPVINTIRNPEVADINTIASERDPIN